MARLHSAALEQLREELVTVKNVGPLTPDAVMDRLALHIQQEKDAKAAIEEDKAVLSIMRKEGLINDKVEHPAFTLSWQTTKRWVYSPAVKELQGLEKVDGSATQTTTENWVARANKPTL